jgi:uncharacterized protein (TIGR03435 family)
MTAGELARALSEALGKPVADSTQLSGKFEVRLTWRLDDPDAAEASARAGLDVREMPSLFTAIQEQLGLRLRSARVSDEMLVVDDIRRLPTEN